MADLTIPEVYPLLASYVDRKGYYGNALHIYIDDGNLKDDSIQHCLESAENGTEYFDPDEEAAALCRLLLRMSATQRLKMYRKLGEDRRGR